MTVHYNALAEAADTTSPVIPIHGRNPYAARRFSIYRGFVKRCLDILLVLMTAPFTVPIVMVLAVLTICDGGAPFYTQLRVGKNGRLYRMWKLRSMVVNADSKLEDHLAANPAARAEWDSTQKLKSDPRVTRFGRILRKCSMDELPQLWNVLVGDMSLVGPRPMMPDQQPLYPGTSYYAMRPGITGIWQVSKRNESTFADRAMFDDAYNNGLSFMTDVRLLLATVRVVVRGTGH
jgi:exopolysaccharide production protein ExoY